MYLEIRNRNLMAIKSLSVSLYTTMAIGVIHLLYTKNARSEEEFVLIFLKGLNLYKISLNLVLKVTSRSSMCVCFFYRIIFLGPNGY